jgi:hypothetical protein
MVANLVARWRSSSNEGTHVQTARTKCSHLSPWQTALLLARPDDGIAGNCHSARTGKRFRQAIAQPPRRCPPWIEQAGASGLPEIKRFCDGLLRDETAIRAAIRLPWSNGQVEGQVHRLKLIKRQMYGRAGFLVLKRRVLPLWSRCVAPMSGRSP